MSELEILYDSADVLIVCFASRHTKRFEYTRTLKNICKDKHDTLFYFDIHSCWYHKGIDGISKNIEETKQYLDSKIKDHNYKKILFMGYSAGGYAAILFGSLCSATHVLAMAPQTILYKPIDTKYTDLKKYINKDTKYLLYADQNVNKQNNVHHISQCFHINDLENVEIRLGIKTPDPFREMARRGLLHDIIIDFMDLR